LFAASGIGVGGLVLMAVTALIVFVSTGFNPDAFVFPIAAVFWGTTSGVGEARLEAAADRAGEPAPPRRLTNTNPRRYPHPYALI